jgi:hypothetical protein
MAKLTRSHSVAALVEAKPVFTAGSSRFTIGITSKQTGATYHLHLSADEAQDFADFVAARRKVGA